MPTVAHLQCSASAASVSRGAVFLDRDGTLMEEVDYCRDPALVRIFPGVRQSLLALKNAGFRLVVVTNQSGIGRGYFSEADFQLVQAELLRQLGPSGLIDATYHCPDHPDRASSRRKPGDGMIREALADLGIDARESYMIGDTSADVLCGKRAGLAGSVLLLTGHGRDHLTNCEPDHVAASFTEAADWVLAQISVLLHE